MKSLLSQAEQKHNIETVEPKETWNTDIKDENHSRSLEDLNAPEFKNTRFPGVVWSFQNRSLEFDRKNIVTSGPKFLHLSMVGSLHLAASYIIKDLPRNHTRMCLHKNSASIPHAIHRTSSRETTGSIKSNKISTRRMRIESGWSIISETCCKYPPGQLQELPPITSFTLLHYQAQNQ